MKKLLIFFLFITFSLSAVFAQEAQVVAPADTVKIPKNFIKFNIASVLIKNYSFQYERILSKTISMAVTFRIMPESGIPYSDNIIKGFDITEPETQDIIKNVKIGNYAITPEIRFYTGRKGYGRGFYFALFYSHARYTVNNANISYTTDLDTKATLKTSGNVSTNTGGFMLGSQWALGKHICLDWWLMGPHFGVSSGEVTGLTSVPLSSSDQQSIRDNLNDIKIPMLKQTVDVTANKINMKFDGPWAGIRAGLSIGIKF
jgi:hypothetical protein